MTNRLQGVPVRVLIILVVLLGLTACSKQSAKVKLQLTSSFAYGGSAATQQVSEGGLMVWGHSTDGYQFSRVLSDTDAIEIDIPNGNWIFSAVAWDSASSTMLDNDAVRCARSAPMKLEGDTAAVPLELKGINCSSVNFHGNASSITANLKVKLCQGTKDIVGATGQCTEDPQEPNRKAGKAPALSVRLRLEEFDNFDGKAVSQGAGLSRCVLMPANRNGEWTTQPDLAFPVGNPSDPTSAPFRTTFEFYQASFDCGVTADAGFSSVTLPHGLASGVAGHKYFGSGTEQHLYLNVSDAQICSGRTALAPFAGGDGSQGHPHLICSVDQLYNVLDATDMNHSYRLMVDINLNPFSKGLSASTPSEWPVAASCWDLGQNWQPIGYDATCSIIATGFRGSFFGGGHTIKGLRMRMDAQKVGFVGDWNPIINDHSITGLVLENPEIEGDSYVGGLVGIKSGSLYSLIANSEIRGGEVIAGQTGNVSDLGGFIGRGTRAQLYNLKTSRVKIEGEGNHIGGIFGYISGSLRIQQLVTRSYVGTPEWASAQYIGGIGGYIGSDNLVAGQFSEWASESIVVGSQYVGGLLGEWASTYNTTNAVHRPLEDVYAAGSVTIRGQNANYLGGLFGVNYNNAVLSNAYFAGSLLNDSRTANCGGACSVGWFSGFARNMTRTQAYVMSENASGHFSLLPRIGFGDDTDGPSGTPIWTIPEVSTANIFVPGSLTGLTSGDWVHVSGDKPRLVIEKHPCSADADGDGISPRSSLAIQKTKWGTATKPMMICRKSQFAEITSELGSGKIGVIVGALNLASSTVDVRPSVVGGAYLTGEGGYIHGLRRVESVASFQWSPFDSITGALKNLLIAGIDLKAVSPIATSSSINGLAQTNIGLIENVKLLTGRLVHDDIDARINGLVALNSGTMRDVSFEGTLFGHGDIAGLVRINHGTIEDSEAAGQILLNDGGNNIAGVTFTNSASGKIRRVRVSSKLDSNSYATAANDVGMVTVTNTGVIQDVHVTAEAYWRAHFASNVAQVAVAHNGTSSSIKRVIVEGFLYDMQDVTTFTSGNMNIVQVLGSANFGSIFAVPAGRLIGEASPSDITNCTGTTLNLEPSFNLLSSFTSGYWQSGMLAGSKVVWVGFDNGDGEVRYTHAIDGAYTAYLEIELNQSCSSLGFDSSTRLKIVQDYGTTLANAGANGELTTAPFIGFTEDPLRFSSTNLADVGLSTDTGWRQNITNAPVSNTVIARGVAGEDWILDIMSELFGVASTTTPTPIWEVEDDKKIELFRTKK